MLGQEEYAGQRTPIYDISSLAGNPFGEEIHNIMEQHNG